LAPLSAAKSCTRLPWLGDLFLAVSFQRAVERLPLLSREVGEARLARGRHRSADQGQQLFVGQS
jgi:hypothetical protein